MTYKAEEKPKPVEKIAMQVAMFKQVVIPQPVVKAEPEFVEKVKEVSEEKKTVSAAKPLSQAKTKKPKVKTKAKPKKTKPKKAIKKKKPKKELKKKPRQKAVAKKSVKPRKPPQKHVVQKRPAPKQHIPKQHTPKQHRQVANNVRPHRKQQAAQVQPRQAKPKPRAIPAKPQQAVGRPTHNPQAEGRYQRSVQQKIEQQKNYPRRAKRMSQQGIVKVGFSLSRSGAISNLRIVQSSGISSLDKATLQAVKKVGRFPAFPKGINKPSINYIIPIAYRLN